MLAKLKRLLYTSILGDIYFNTLLWLNRKKTKVNLEYIPPSNRIVYNQQQALYKQAVDQVKTKILSKASEAYNGNVAATLEANPELVNLAAKDEESNNYVAALKTQVRVEKDIKNDTDVAEMIDQRIRDYKELHKHIEKRNKLREQRKNNGRK